MTSTGQKTIKVIPFKGTAEEWPSWELKFLARASALGYYQVLIRDVTEDQYITIGEGDQARREKVMDVNKCVVTAFQDLVLSMDTTDNAGKVALALVRRSKSEDFPNGGDARVAFENLKRRFEPKNAQTLGKLTRKFHNTAMKKGDDPDLYLLELENTRYKLEEMGESITDQAFFLKVINGLSNEYIRQVEDFEKKLNANQPITIEEIHEAVVGLYFRLQSETDDGKEDQAMAMTGQYKGYCRECGKYGHHPDVCRSKGGGKNVIIVYTESLLC